MGIRSRSKLLLASALCAALFAVPFAHATSSFTYATFEKLVSGSYVAPDSPSLSYATQLKTPIVAAPTAPGTGSLSAGPLEIEVAALSATGCQSAPKFDPGSASNVDPSRRW